MTWRLAKSLEVLRSQINIHYPNRSKVSDGTIGDTAHQSKGSKSDHNPRDGIVCAFDITNDPVHGPNLSALIPLLLKDKRTRYVIFNKKIYNPTIQNGSARPYNGANAHQKHLHISCNWQFRDQGQTWVLAPQGSTAVATVKPSLKRGSKGADVTVLQARLRTLGYYKELTDGDFTAKTEAAVKAFQKDQGLKADGIVGPKTWEKLAVAPVKAADPSKEQKGYDPLEAISYFKSLGWSDVAAIALVANLMWESGGNAKATPTLVFNAHGDRDKDGIYRSHGAGQWNEKAGRYDALLNFAREREKSWDDPHTQLAFLDHELHTTERRAGTALRAATTLEEAVAAAILVWRPSIPHADRRLAIARKLSIS